MHQQTTMLWLTLLSAKSSVFLLRGPAAEWYRSNIEAVTPSDDIRSNFITRFADERNKIRHRMEVEHCNRRVGEEVFFHRHFSIESEKK